MELNHKQSLEFKESVRSSLPANASQSWLNSLQLLKITPAKVVIAGIPHKVYLYEIKTNHEKLLTKVLDKLYPEKAPFSEKKFVYKIGSNSKTRKAVQTEFNLNQEQFAAKIDNPELQETLSSKQTEPAVSSSSVNLLDSYIPGKRNLLAIRACKAVVDMPGIAFNPFVIYGESGTGKSHLLEGINNELQHAIPKKQTVLVSAEDFLNNFVTHLRINKMKDFRDMYRKVDVFLLDDLHALTPSSKCQTELLYTINALRKKKAQIVIACKEPPTQMQSLSAGLCGKLESGLTVDIGMPDNLTKVEILESKAKERGIPLSNELSNFIVQHIKGGIGRLEGALIRLGVHASLLNEELTTELAQYALKDWLDNSSQKPDTEKLFSEHYTDETEKKIIRRICVMFQISEDGLRSQSRDRKHIKARQAAVFLLKELTSLSLNEIGKIIGRNHSTVHSTLKKVRLRMTEDDFFLKQMKTFQQQIENKPVSSQIPEQKRNFSL